jgi:hypothetical protein
MNQIIRSYKIFFLILFLNSCCLAYNSTKEYINDGSLNHEIKLYEEKIAKFSCEKINTEILYTAKLLLKTNERQKYSKLGTSYEAIMSLGFSCPSDYEISSKIKILNKKKEILLNQQQKNKCL